VGNAVDSLVRYRCRASAVSRDDQPITLTIHSGAWGFCPHRHWPDDHEWEEIPSGVSYEEMLGAERRRGATNSHPTFFKQSMERLPDTISPKFARATAGVGDRQGRVVAQPEPTDLLEIGAHDLIQPLTSVKAQADVLARHIRNGTASPEVLLEGLASISDRASALADRLAEAIVSHRHGASAFAIHASRCDLAQLLDTLLSNLGPEERRRIVVRRDQGALEGYWDGPRIAQVLRDLVQNALKYSAPGSRINLQVSASDTNVRVTVRDTGIGLTPEELGSLFERSYRSARVAGVQGTGLGLYASRVTVEAHGGRIWAESDGAGMGAAFHVELPRSVSASPSRATRNGPVPTNR
jgi:signal transduction histidine kinase